MDGWVIEAVLRIVEQHRHEVGQLIANTVSAWDPEETSRRIELQMGRDLQFIRINGTLVGGWWGWCSIRWRTSRDGPDGQAHSTDGQVRSTLRHGVGGNRAAWGAGPTLRSFAVVRPPPRAARLPRATFLKMRAHAVGGPP